MSGITSVLEILKHHEQLDHEMVLATVVKTLGSSYRRPGARMIIPAVGVAVGMVSGGCLEADLVKKAWWRTSNGSSLIVYDTNEDGDTVDGVESGGFGTGCHGQITILLERSTTASAALMIDVLDRVVCDRSPAAIATLVSGRRGMGERLVMETCQSIRGTLADTGLQDQIIPYLAETLALRKSSFRSFDSSSGPVSVFCEYVKPPQRLVIFGAGNDVPPLLKIAKLWGWQVSVIDSRSHFAKASRFPEAEAVVHATLEAPFAFDALITDAAVVVMTHSLVQDRHWLAHCLRGRTAYLGQLGPIDRTERLLGAMSLQEKAVAEAKLHYPVGLDIGGDSPEFVAVSILAEIAAVLEKRPAYSYSVQRRMQVSPA